MQLFSKFKYRLKETRAQLNGLCFFDFRNFYSNSKQKNVNLLIKHLDFYFSGQ